LLTAGGSSLPPPLHKLNGPPCRGHEVAAAYLWSTGQQVASTVSSAARLNGGAAFHVQRLLAQHPERGAPPPGRQVMLPAYRAHLAERIRYLGPLMPVDLRV
jgi:hypothetical protein